MIFLVLASLWSRIESSQIRSFEPQPLLGKLPFNVADHLATPEYRWLHLRCLSSHAYDPKYGTIDDGVCIEYSYRNVPVHLG